MSHDPLLESGRHQGRIVILLVTLAGIAVVGLVGFLLLGGKPTERPFLIDSDESSAEPVVQNQPNISRTVSQADTGKGTLLGRVVDAATGENLGGLYLSVCLVRREEVTMDEEEIKALSTLRTLLKKTDRIEDLRKLREITNFRYCYEEIRESPVEVRTGPDGRFRIPELPQGVYAARAGAGKYMGPVVYRIRIPRGGCSEEVAFRLETGCNPTLRFTFNGEPFKDRRVSVFFNPIEDESSPDVLDSMLDDFIEPVLVNREIYDRTGADGTLQIHALKPGAYKVSASCGWIRTQKSKPHKVGPGGNPEIKIEFTGRSISGTVRDMENRPLPGALIFPATKIGFETYGWAGLSEEILHAVYISAKRERTTIGAYALYILERGSIYTTQMGTPWGSYTGWRGQSMVDLGFAAHSAADGSYRILVHEPLGRRGTFGGHWTESGEKDVEFGVGAVKRGYRSVFSGPLGILPDQGLSGVDLVLTRIGDSTLDLQLLAPDGNALVSTKVHLKVRRCAEGKYVETEQDATTDPKGIVSFAGLIPGLPYEFIISGKGFYEAKGKTEPLKADRRTVLVVQLVRGAVIRVVVTDEGGNPVPDATVGLADRSDMRSIPETPDDLSPDWPFSDHFRVLAEKTKETGVYRFSDLKPGLWGFGIHAEGYDIHKEKPFEVGPGELIERKVVLRKIPLPGAVQGIVLDENGTPVTGAHLHLQGKKGRSYSGIKTREGDVDESLLKTKSDGSFFLAKVPAGSWQLTIQANPKYRTLQISVPPGETLDLGAIRFGEKPKPVPPSSSAEADPGKSPPHPRPAWKPPPTFEVSGRVTGLPAEILKNRWYVRVFLCWKTQWGVRWSKGERIGRDGSFRFKAAPGTYRIIAWCPSGWIAGPSEVFTVSDGEGRGGLALTARRGGVIKGVVRDGKGPAADVRVWIESVGFPGDWDWSRWMDDALSGRFSRRSFSRNADDVDSSGVFRGQSLLAGEYRIRVEREGYLSLERKVSVLEGNVTEETFLFEKLLRFTGKLRLRILLPKGGPAEAYVRLRFSQTLGRDMWQQKWVDEDGVFFRDDLPLGRAWAEVTFEGYASKRLEVVVTEAEQDITVRLSLGGAISGRVFGPPGIFSKLKVAAVLQVPDMRWSPQAVEGSVKSDGTYRIDVLSEGLYTVYFDVDELRRTSLCAGAEYGLFAVKDVPVRDRADTKNVDFRTESGTGSMSVQVPLCPALQGFYVRVYLQSSTVGERGIPLMGNRHPIKNGACRISGIPRGRYVFNLFCAKPKERGLSVIYTEEGIDILPSNESRLRVPLDRYGSISGTVVLAQAKGLSTSVTAEGGGFRITADIRDGAFHMPIVPAGEYRVTAYAGEQTYSGFEPAKSNEVRVKVTHEGMVKGIKLRIP